LVYFSFRKIIFYIFIYIEFNTLRQAYESKRQLSGKDITLIQVYECDAAELHYLEENKPITHDDIQKIIKNVSNDIFAWNFPTEYCAEIEFINANGKITEKV
jgi:hypothetical protein